jgi:hypothetical protein
MQSVYCLLTLCHTCFDAILAICCCGGRGKDVELSAEHAAWVDLLANQIIAGTLLHYQLSSASQ